MSVKQQHSFKSLATHTHAHTHIYLQVKLPCSPQSCASTDAIAFVA